MRMVRAVLLISLMMIVAAGCGSIPIGDGASLEIGRDGGSIKTADGEEIQINVDRDKESMSIKGTDAEGKEYEQKISQQGKIPDGFPAEIPIPEDVELFVSETEIEGKMQVLIQYEIKGKVIDYYNMYRKYVDQAGYTNIIDASKGEAKSDTKLENILAKLDGTTVSIGMMVSGTGKYDDGTVIVNIMYIKDIL